ncbi:hypothetical protein SD939_10315 [Lactobacillus crispatus]|uniref:hypothetical protein n=1 Tax=Lactobacillus crispatus TaxID=47770 RepID=UPI0029C1DBF2|nr:hypothetical protein [Lactobacillus crispatus]MDX5091599.1 hypothetical protein [Lactobacillus crispatus]
MEYEVTVDSQKIDYGATGAQAILQNIRFILCTVESSCPLDRAFAWKPDLDAPFQIAQARTRAKIMEAIRSYEPRVEVTQITFQGNALEGQLKPIVKVRIRDEPL